MPVNLEHKTDMNNCYNLCVFAPLREGIMNENELSKIIVDRCLKIHKKLGPGLLESVYEEILFYELQKTNLRCKKAGCNTRSL
jgi:hypothetical protein